jgi:hypothetical protein
MLGAGTITVAHVGSWQAQECSAATQTAYSWVTLEPLCNSRSDPEKASYENRFHLIVIRYITLIKRLCLASERCGLGPDLAGKNAGWERT